MYIYSIGEMVIDFIPGEEKGSYIRNAGGVPANVAIAAARNGLETEMCCKVGEDDFGKFLMETLKKEGAQVFFGNSIFTVGGRTVKAVDATGAGDAFWGGFLSSLLLQGVTRPEEITEPILRKAMEYGNISGALCVQKKGAISSLPTREEIEEIIRSESL